MKLGSAIRQYQRKLRAGADGGADDPLFFHSRISRENPYFLRLEREPSCRHSYAWGVLQAAALARSLNVPRISVLEFGVAGGNGLVALERISENVSSHYGVGVDVYGFDTGAGMPAPEDWRDLPDICGEGDFSTDPDALKKRLKSAGLAKDTAPAFLRSRPAPVGFISFDMDFYSSTMQAFRVLETDQEMYFVPASRACQMFWDKYYMAFVFDHKLYARNIVGPRLIL